MDNLKMATLKHLDSCRVLDHATGCSVDMVQLMDGRFAIQFDKASDVTFKTEAELLTENPRPHGIPTDDQYIRWIPMELLRKHVSQHLLNPPEMSYVELAAK